MYLLLSYFVVLVFDVVNGKYLFDSRFALEKMIAQDGMMKQVKGDKFDNTFMKKFLVQCSSHLVHCKSITHLSLLTWAWACGFVITDIDECVTDAAHECLKDLAHCFNTLGSYTCACKYGYYGDGKTSCLPLPAGALKNTSLCCNSY